MYLSVIIPAKNEEKHIQKTVQSVSDYLDQKGFEHEIIVVANNSTDRTAAIVKDLMNQIPTLKLIDYKGVIGKGYAVRKGILAAAGQYRLFMDADNAVTIDHLEKMMPYFEQGYDVVIGSVAVKGHDVVKGSEPLWRVLFGKAGNLFIQLMTVPGIHDTQRGFKIISAVAADKIFPLLKISRWAFDVEILALARKFGYKIKEVPVKFSNDPNTSSHPKLSDYPKFFFEVIKIRWWLLTGQYTRATM